MADIDISGNVLLRYASECGPEGQGGAKGGYLKGSIRLPDRQPGQVLRMVLTVAPTEEVVGLLRTELGERDFYPQPLMLYVRRMAGKIRQKDWEPVPSSHHWRINFIIEVRQASHSLTDFPQTPSQPCHDFNSNWFCQHS